MQTEEITSSYKERIEHQFDTLVKIVLKGEAKNYKKKIFERAAHEITFSDMSDSPIETMGVCDEYMTDYFGFNVDGQRIYIKNELLGVAVSLLSEQKRNIILMSYFLEMTDDKIADRLNINRSNVTHHRHSTLKILKRYMEDMKYGKIQRN